MRRPYNVLKQLFKGCFTPMLMNIVGMTIAFIAAIVILVQVNYDLNYESCHVNADRIYKLQIKYPTANNDSVGHINTLSIPFVEELLQNVRFFDIKRVAYADLTASHRSWHGDTCDFAVPFYMVDGNFIDMFSFELISGCIDQFKNGENVVLIPESVALKQWGHTDVVGVAISGERQPYKVGAVYKDFPSNTLVKNYVYMPIVRNIERDVENWRNWNYSVFVELKENVDGEEVMSRISSRLKEIKDDVSLKSSLNVDEWDLDMIKISDLHYVSNFVEFNDANISKNDVILLLVISIVIILIAGFNFVNFMIALVPKKLRTINLQRILGASRKKIIVGLIFESIGFVVLSWVLAVLVITFFADEWLFGTSSVRMVNGDLIKVYIYTFVGAAVLGLVMAVYPIISLAFASPRMGLRRNFGISRKGKRLQKILLTLQFLCAITLVSCSYTMLLQERYITTAWNENAERMVFAFMKDTIPDSQPLYERMMGIEGVEDVALSLSILSSQDQYMQWRWSDVKATVFPVSRNYIDVMGINMIDGRAFSSEDTMAMVFNETARDMYPDMIAVGEYFASSDDFKGIKIVGICKDVNFKSLRSEIEPMAFVLENDNNLTCVNVRLEDNCDIENAKLQLSSVLDETDKNYKHNFKTYDEIYGTTYRYERLTTNRIKLFALVVIIISIMGVCGIVVINGEYRLKEIALKKVFCAGKFRILRELLYDYVKMLVVAILLSIPIYYYFMNMRWLAHFYYHVEFSWDMYVVPTMVLVVVILSIAVLYTLKYLRNNPVDILKYE